MPPRGLALFIARSRFAQALSTCAPFVSSPSSEYTGTLCACFHFLRALLNAWRPSTTTSRLPGLNA